jgi:ABC-type lipoprotein export system ATPase subunit
MARALVLSPPLILADEPTGNLDSKNGQEILALFKSLRQRFSTTVIMVTHDPRAAACCDRILALQDGRLVGNGE